MEYLPTTVHVLTGFLGSGKTTVLNRLLRAPDLCDTAVIVNEFGEIPLDHLLVQNVSGETVVLANGCVCCTVRDDLAGALIELFEGVRQGELPSFSRVFIETTGLADPVPVLGTLENHPVVRHHVRRGLVITTVDVLHAFSGPEWAGEAVHQISAADWIIVTKTDLAPPARNDRAIDSIRALNPLAEISAGADETVRRLIALAATGADELAHDLATSAEAPLAKIHSHAHDEHHHHHGGASDVSSISIALDEPIDWPAFGVWVSLLLHAHGDRILRLKGLLNVRGNDKPIFVNGVRHVLHRPIHLKSWPDENRRSRLVVILAGLNPSVVRRSLDIWLARAGEI